MEKTGNLIKCDNLHEVNLNVNVCFKVLENTAKPTINEHAERRTPRGSGTFVWNFRFLEEILTEYLRMLLSF